MTSWCQYHYVFSHWHKILAALLSHNTMQLCIRDVTGHYTPNVPVTLKMYEYNNVPVRTRKHVGIPYQPVCHGTTQTRTQRATVRPRMVIKRQSMINISYQSHKPTRIHQIKIDNRNNERAQYSYYVKRPTETLSLSLWARQDLNVSMTYCWWPDVHWLLRLCSSMPAR